MRKDLPVVSITISIFWAAISKTRLFSMTIDPLESRHSHYLAIILHQSYGFIQVFDLIQRQSRSRYQSISIMRSNKIRNSER